MGPSSFINYEGGVEKGIKEIPIISLEPGVSQVIKSLLADKDIHLPIRVELKNSGCCDALLGLRADTLRNSDLTVESDGVIFLIAPETYEITGDVIISYVDQAGKKGFMMTSYQHVSEWDGFAVTEIEI